MRSLDEFRAQLRDARRFCRSGPVLLSALGLALRQVDPAFDPHAFGYDKLSSLLRAVGDVGRFDPRTAAFVFEGEDEGPNARQRNIRLRRDIWDAVTAFRPSSSWQFDLADFSVRNADTNAELLAEEAHRFIALPTADFDYQRQLALDFARERRPESVAELDAALEDGLGAANELFEEAGVGEAWRAFRTSKILGLVSEWAERHGIPMDRLRARGDRQGSPVELSRARVEARAVVREEDPHPGSADVRAVIHAAIDLMSAAELAALPIPPVYLAIAAARLQR